MSDFENSDQGIIRQEAEMIRRAQQNIQDFEPLYNRYFESIFRYVFRKVDNEQVTADLTSQIFLKAMNALPKYEIRNVSFGAWLYKIATNETYKYFRDNKRPFLSLEYDMVDHVMTCDNIESEEEKLAVLKKLILELDETEIRILELKFFENRNFREIGFVLDKKESAVKMKLYRALNKLRDKYQEMSNQS